MATYRVTAPNGRTYRVEGPAGASQDDVVAEVMRQYPDAAQRAEPAERSWAEAGTDIAAGAVKGVGNVVALPGQLYGLATGDFSETGALGLGNRIAAKGESMKSEGLKAREQARDASVAQAAEEGGQWEAFKTALSETIKDPALVSSFLAEMAPQLLPIIATGGTAAAVTSGRVAAQQLAAGATKSTATKAAQIAATKAGTTAAVQTGAVMQGTDVGADTYDAIYQRTLESTGSQEAAAEAALNRARAAGVAGYGLSVLANRFLPGGQALERALVGGGTKAGIVKGAAVGALKEIPSENVEEVGGALARNLAVRDADPTQSLTEGLGQTAAMATIGAVGMGGGVGAYGGRRAQVAPEQEPPTNEVPDPAGTDTGPVDPDGDIGAVPDEALARRLAELKNDDTPEGVQLRASIERLQTERMTQQALSQEMPGDYAGLVQKRESLRALPESAATRKVIKQIESRINAMDTQQVAALQEQTARRVVNPKREAKLASQSAFAQPEANPDLFGLVTPPAPPQVPEMERPEFELTPPEPMQFEQQALDLEAEQEPYLAPSQAMAQRVPYVQMPLAPTKRKPRAKPGVPTPPAAQPAPQAQQDFDPEAPLTEAEVVAAGAPAEFVGQTRLDLTMRAAEEPEFLQTPGVATLLGETETETPNEQPPTDNRPVRSTPARPTGPGVGTPDGGGRQPRGARARAVDPSAANRVDDLRQQSELRPGREKQAPSAVTPAVLQRLERVQTQEEFTSAMDALVEVQQDPDSPEQDEVSNFVAKNIREPVFARALEQAEGRARQRRAKAEQGVRGAVDKAKARQAEEDVDPFEGDELAQLAAAVDRRLNNPDLAKALRKHARYRTKVTTAKPANPIGDPELRRIVQQVAQSLDVSPDTIMVMDSVRDLDASQAPGTRAGAVVGGQAYLFRDGIGSEMEGQQSVFHELLHLGLRKLLPPTEFRMTMSRLYKNDPMVRQLADKWLASEVGREAAAELAKKVPPEYLQAETQAVAVDEVLAEMAETRKLPGAVQKLGNWLANLAARMGMGKLSRAIRTMGMTELEAFVDDALRAAGDASKEAAVVGDRYRTVKPAQTAPNAQQVRAEVGRTLKVLAMEPEPIQTRAQKAAAVFNDTVNNPKATAQDLRSRGNAFVDRMGNKMFSSNFALDSAFRRAIPNEAKEKLGWLLKTSDAQPDGSSVVAGVFARMGDIKYDPETFKWRGEEGKTSLEDLARTISDITTRYGLEPAQADRVMHSYFIARRALMLDKRNDQLRTDAAVLAATGNKSRATELRKQIVQFLPDPEWVTEALALADSIPELNDAVKQWNDIRKTTIDVVVQSGLWSKDMAEDMLSAAEWVPFYRAEQLAENKGPKEFISGLTSRAADIRGKRIKGSDAEINDVFDNMMRWTQHAIERSVRNHMANQRADAAVEFGLAEEVSIDAGKTEAPNKVVIYKDGLPRAYNMADPLYMESFQGLESVALPILKGMARWTNLLRQTVVLNPLFGVLQVPQDAIAAIFTSGLKPQYAFTIPARAVKEFLQTLFVPETSEAHKELRRYGAVGARDTTADVVRSDLEFMEGARRDVSLPDRAWRYVSQVLNHVAMASDSSVRQAVYNASLAAGLSKAEAVEKSFQLINFRNRGTSKTLAVAARLIPFFNAYLAAQHVAYKTISGRGTSPADRSAALQTLAATTLSVAGLSALYAMMVGGDDGYEKRPLYVRDRVLVIPGTGGLSIPMRADIFAFPKVIAEHLWHHITESGSVDGANTRRSLKDLTINSLLSPTVVPQAFKPLAEVVLNYDLFRQRPLVGASLAKGETEVQYTDATSELGKLVGKTGVMSPIAFDHLLRGYAGSLGGLLLYSTNDMIGAATGVPRPSMPLWDAIATFPGASTLLPKQNDSAMRQDFYELKDALDGVTSTISRLNDMDPQALDAYLENETTLTRAGLAKGVNQAYRELVEIRKAISVVKMDRAMSPQEKEAEVKELYQMELELLESLDIKGLREMAEL
jgi:hypothetical protein